MNFQSVSSRLFTWEIGGIFFLVIFGSILHFTYEWSNYNPIVGLFSPVNESVWEHLKMGFWSLFLFSLIEYPFVKDSVNNFITAKTIGILTLELVIVVVFYAYTSLTGSSILFIDISLYVAGSVLCQLISCRIMMQPQFKASVQYTNAAILIALGISFMLFTFYPPRLPVFKDERSNSYGIQSHYVNHTN